MHITLASLHFKQMAKDLLISSKSCIKSKFIKLKNSITLLSIKITLLIFKHLYWCIIALQCCVNIINF